MEGEDYVAVLVPVGEEAAAGLSRPVELAGLRPCGEWADEINNGRINSIAADDDGVWVTGTHKGELYIGELSFSSKNTDQELLLAKIDHEGNYQRLISFEGSAMGDVIAMNNDRIFAGEHHTITPHPQPQPYTYTPHTTQRKHLPTTGILTDSKATCRSGRVVW